MGVETLPAEIVDAVRRMGLVRGGGPAGLGTTGTRLTGGVSSDIWRVDLPCGSVCVKRALSRLRVDADWRAPVERNGYEAEWMRRAALAVPGAVPALLGRDDMTRSLAMEYLAPDRHPLWKAELRDGHADAAFAALVGERLATIHAATSSDPSTGAAFPTDAIFFAIRLEPYLLATAVRHPDLAGALHALVECTQANKRALVHGDVSPKNILVGPGGPVFLDAECAWWGDPAFDLAFCLNHMLLKCMWTPAARDQLLACFDALGSRYLEGVAWEERAGLEARAAGLLAGLLLARVDGKSPVEYITTECDRDHVRRVARGLLASPAVRLSQVRDAWNQELTR